MPYDPQQQAAVDAYLAGGGNQAAVDAYFAGNPSQEQFLRDAGEYWDIPIAGSVSSDPNANPNYAKLKSDVYIYALTNGVNIADIDAYFAGNPSYEQLATDASRAYAANVGDAKAQTDVFSYFGLPSDYKIPEAMGSSRPPGAQAAPPIDPKYEKLKSDAIAYYLANGGNQAELDAYFAGNPSYEKLATDVANAYMQRMGGGAAARENIHDYFTVPNASGTNLGPDETLPNTGPWSPGSGDPIRDPWEVDYKYVDPQGNPRPGYGWGADGKIVKLEGGVAPQATPQEAPQQGEPSIFDMFKDLFSNFTQAQQTPKNPNWYYKDFMPGSARDPMVVQNAIANQTDPNSSAGLFKRLYKNFNEMQQLQGGSRAVMPALDQAPAQQSDPYKSQYVVPPPPPPPAPPPPPKTPRQVILDQADKRVNRPRDAVQEYEPGF